MGKGTDFKLRENSLARQFLTDYRILSTGHFNNIQPHIYSVFN